MAGMRWLRGLGRVIGAGLWAVALAPILALGPAAVLDRGPGGAVRATPFPVALAAFDPYVWVCARNSLVVAAAVTAAAGVLGVALAQVAVGWRFWGRRPLTWLACAGVAVHPAFGAIGLRWALAQARPGSVGSDLAAWSVWAWVALAWAGPVVALAAAASLEGVDPAWDDAARLAGASRRRIWRDVVWPLVRPDVARVLALVFGLTLLDPGAPLVLGLRRTLGFQIVASALTAREPGQLSRAVVLALMGTAMALIGRELLQLWGRTRPAGLDDPPGPVARPETASWRRSSAFGLAFMLAVVLVWLPLLALVAASLSAPGASLTSTSGRSWAAYVALASDPLSQRFVMNALILGLAVLAADLVLARALVGLMGVFRGRFAALARWSNAIPPLAVGVGALALPRLVAMAADLVETLATGSWPLHRLATALLAVADALDVDRTPGVLLLLGVASARVSLTAFSAVDRHRRLRPSPIEAAVVLGARRGRARRKLAGRWLLGVAPAAAVLTLAVAATSPVPALVLSPTAETRPVGPAILSLADEPAPGPARAAALATVAVAVNVVALALAARGRSGSVRAWLRA
jgi:ABC-type Fe3+ transport system permease subunit